MRAKARGRARELLDAIAQERAGAMRYAMLESIHVYAGRRLDEAGERETLVRRHLAWLTELAGRAESPPGGGTTKAAGTPASDVELVEKTLAARKDYQIALEQLRAHYISVGDRKHGLTETPEILISFS